MDNTKNSLHNSPVSAGRDAHIGDVNTSHQINSGNTTYKLSDYRLLVFGVVVIFALIIIFYIATQNRNIPFPSYTENSSLNERNEIEKKAINNVTNISYQKENSHLSIKDKTSKQILIPEKIKEYKESRLITFIQ